MWERAADKRKPPMKQRGLFTSSPMLRLQDNKDLTHLQVARDKRKAEITEN